jgi:hypothetical protein
VLGALTLAGFGAIVTGVVEGIGGRMNLGQVAIQIGAGLVLGASGGIPLYFYFVAREAAARTLARRQQRYPDQPWMWSARWSTRRLRYSARGPIAFASLVLVVMGAGLVFVSYMNREQIATAFEESPFQVIIFYAIFCSLLLLGVRVVVGLFRGYLTSGHSTFELEGPCGVVGSELAGTIRTGLREIPPTGFDIGLTSVHCDFTVRTDSGSTGRDEEPLWGTRQHLSAEQAVLGPAGIEIPVRIPIPGDARESDEWSPLERVKWTLTAQAILGGRLYYSEFLVPVFRARTMQT